MKLKIILALFSLLVFGKLYAQKSSSNMVELHVKIMGTDIKPFYIVENELITKNEKTLGSGTNKLSLNCVFPKVVYLIYDKARIMLFLEVPGDMFIEFSSKDVLNSIAFSGANNDINNYLVSSARLNQSTFKNLESTYNLKPKDFIAVNETLFRKQMDSFQAHFNDKKVSKLFRSFVEIENTYHNLIRRIQYPDYYNYFSKDVIDTGEVYFRLPENTISQSETALLSPSFIRYSELYIRECLKKLRTKNFSTEVSVLQLEDLKNEEVVINKLPISKGLKSFYIASLLNHYLELGFMEQFKTKAKEQQKSTYFNVVDYKARAMELLEPGKKAPSFAFKDITGKEYSLFDFKGKTVVINIWSTSCHFSMDEVPYYEKMMAKFQDSVTFINLSNEPFTKETLAFLNQHQAFIGVHGYAGGFGSNFHQNYFINGTPRYMIIDKNGNIVNAFAPRPTSPSLSRLISGLE
ncbi:TlpA disulfide reductase family protein [Pedobacter sp. Hv1]|uniref:TlpA family protein disulfide reductase n=1 Tax=Pedobacter sp. Hv1 TaxID=1740090 RepID=UPI0006D8BF2C|nr:TlpA disulfide reductase family protein [Pedobacter sp. Hv1]KQC01459.1 hypothetical protein AQF98_07060 [Pedobacter sp. Hv1]